MAVVTDTIADMLTRIRNANQMRYEEVRVPASNLKKEIARILKDEGFIKDYKLEKNDVQGTLILTLKYTEKKERVIILSTSKGIMTDKEARKQNIGGEVLAYIW